MLYEVITFRLSGGSSDSFEWTVGAFYHNSETPVTGLPTRTEQT